MKLAVIYNEPRNTVAEDHWLRRSDPSYRPPSSAFVDASEFGVLQQMQSIADALSNHGHEVIVFSANDDPQRLCSFLNNEQPDVIFNCCESILGNSKLEMNVAAMYELFGIPYTGSPALTLGLALDKALTKSLFVANGIPTPKHQLFSSDQVSIDPTLRFPLIVKPVHEDASIGIDARAIVRNDNELLERVRFVLREFEQPALVEEFIDGRELNIGVIGGPETLETLPISEITFDKMAEGEPRIVSYEAKWIEESPLYHSTVPRCPATLPSRVEAEARRIALLAARAVGLRDYGRVDLRMDSSERLYVLEANPNPDISEDAGFMRAARVSGRTYAGTINEILELALARANDHAQAKQSY
ncbi:MAG TPA: ATP-grasp domain-containing protein [Candidatus Kapabacteria bacterium]|nr:ATP-grasp domain-containing protein [Candidatus Kapabacteria bacterium]